VNINVINVGIPIIVGYKNVKANTVRYRGVMYKQDTPGIQKHSISFDLCVSCFKKLEEFINGNRL